MKQQWVGSPALYTQYRSFTTYSFSFLCENCCYCGARLLLLANKAKLCSDNTRIASKRHFSRDSVRLRLLMG